ncbi:hypothetical protein S101_23625, partial [Salmonella enterica subsp. enterica serovar Tennessee]
DHTASDYTPPQRGVTHHTIGVSPHTRNFSQVALGEQAGVNELFAKRNECALDDLCVMYPKVPRGSHVADFGIG